MSIPEPPPVKKGKEVAKELIEFILIAKLDNEQKRKIIELITERYEFGMKKYGQPLMTEDGRDDINDALQELGDLMQYIYKAKMNGRLGELKEMINLFIEFWLIAVV